MDLLNLGRNELIVFYCTFGPPLFLCPVSYNLWVCLLLLRTDGRICNTFAPYPLPDHVKIMKDEAKSNACTKALRSHSLTSRIPFLCAGSPSTRLATVAFSAGAGLGSAYSDASRLFEGTKAPSKTHLTTVSNCHIFLKVHKWSPCQTLYGTLFFSKTSR
jgi:hypothetical protein